MSRLIKRTLANTRDALFLAMVGKATGSVVEYIKDTYYLLITLENDNEMFAKTLKFLETHKESDTLQLLSKRGFVKGEYGRRIYKYRGRYVLVNLSRVRILAQVMSRLRIQFVSNDPDIIDAFTTDVNDVKGDKVEVSTADEKRWKITNRLEKRYKNTLFTETDVLGEIITHIEDFTARREENLKLGIGHHTGILMSGPPGTAKTSFIHVLASELGRGIRYLNFSMLRGEADLLELLNKVDWQKSFLVLEDIDAADVEAADREATLNTPVYHRAKIGMATFLNVLDGILTPPDLIVLATTNHVSHIDPAVLRPGRFDKHVTLDLIGRSAFDRMAVFFHHDPTAYTLDTFLPMSGAHLRSLLLSGGVEAVEAYQKTLLV